MSDRPRTTARVGTRSSDFDPTRLTLARRLRKVSKSALARDVGITASAVSQYERGDVSPTQPVVSSMALRLGVDRTFLSAGRALRPLPAGTAHFRSLRKTTAMAREQALAYGEIGLELVALIEQYAELPEIDLPAVDLGEDPAVEAVAEAAAAAREAWSIGPGPIAHVVRLLETRGVIVMRLPEDVVDRDVDAFSSEAGHRPVVMLSPLKNDKARSRFDAAHELGHLVMHHDCEPGSKLLENQAQAFASEFLMPASQIIDDLPRRVDWRAFHELKRHWGVSLRALVFRAHHLGRLSEASYRRANRQLSGWGLPEPGPLGPPESPTLLGASATLLTDNGIDLDAVVLSAGLDLNVAHSIIAASTDHRPRLEL